jgi:hypothetical protein
MSLCEKQINLAKKPKFSYTLAFKSEYDKYPAPKEQREKLVAKLGSELKSTLNTVKQNIPSISTLNGLVQDAALKVSSKLK